MQQLAAWHAVGIEDEQLDHVDIGVLFKEQACVFDGCEFHGQSLTMAPRRRAESGRTRRGKQAWVSWQGYQKEKSISLMPGSRK
ncbi:hypothetical protein HT737_04850 [Pseudomonas sp. MD195_PC81_125]|uniref:hypothetical protein n=1 Tax=Pseudomonas sp. MD195_PC81_125 TaxID=2741560 RepID=UPI0015FC233C|nr:hypothetical protein [Pseudomonas sp. MD195_PC81_125]MBA5979461.1 hypothetical protein [Pseudomonas sp. MD195_PC81_125]